MPIDGRKTTMRKLVALAAVVMFALVLPSLAVAKGTHKSTPHVSGTITSLDANAKQATVKDAAGNETSFGWNDKTMVTGTPKVGEHASVAYMKDQDGKLWATHFSVGAKPATPKPAAAKPASK